MAPSPEKFSWSHTIPPLPRLEVGKRKGWPSFNERTHSPLFPRKSELWCRGTVPGRGQPSGAACSCPEVWEYNQEPGRGRLERESWLVLQNSFPGLRSEDGGEGVTVKVKKGGCCLLPSPMEEGMKHQKTMAFTGLSQQSGCPGSRPVSPLWAPAGDTAAPLRLRELTLPPFPQPWTQAWCWPRPSWLMLIPADSGSHPSTPSRA